MHSYAFKENSKTNQIYQLAKNGDNNRLDQLLETTCVDVHDGYYTASMRLAEEKDFAGLRRLLKRGASPSYPLFSAAKIGDKLTVDYLYYELKGNIRELVKGAVAGGVLDYSVYTTDPYLWEVAFGRGFSTKTMEECETYYRDYEIYCRDYEGRISCSGSLKTTYLCGIIISGLIPTIEILPMIKTPIEDIAYIAQIAAIVNNQTLINSLLTTYTDERHNLLLSIIKGAALGGHPNLIQRVKSRAEALWGIDATEAAILEGSVKGGHPDLENLLKSGRSLSVGKINDLLYEAVRTEHFKIANHLISTEGPCTFKNERLSRLLKSKEKTYGERAPLFISYFSPELFDCKDSCPQKSGSRGTISLKTSISNKTLVTTNQIHRLMQQRRFNPEQSFSWFTQHKLLLYLFNNQQLQLPGVVIVIILTYQFNLDEHDATLLYNQIVIDHEKENSIKALQSFHAAHTHLSLIRSSEAKKLANTIKHSDPSVTTISLLKEEKKRIAQKNKKDPSYVKLLHDLEKTLKK